MNGKKFQEWIIKLKNGKEFEFLVSDEKFSNNPLEQIPEYSKGQYWSVPGQKLEKYKKDPDNQSNILIPKHEVENVYRKEK